MRGMMDQFYLDLDHAYSQGGIAGAEQFLLAHIAAPTCDQPLIAAHNELGSLYRGTSRYDCSLAAFEQARTLSCRIYGPSSSAYATVLNNMAGTHRLAQNFPEAIELFQQALELYRSLGMENSYPYASALNNLSLVYQDLRQLPPAIDCLEQALALIETMPERRQELAITLNNLATLYHALGEREKAAALLARSLQEFEACPKEENVHYAAGLNNLASCLYAIGDYPRALEAYERSAEHTMYYFGENIEFAITCQNIYRVHAEMGRPQNGAPSLLKAKTVYEKLLGPEHERTRRTADELEKLQEAGMI